MSTHPPTPRKIHLEDVGSYYQAQHRHGEEAQVSVETLHTLLIFLNLVVLIALCHIAEAVDVNHEADGGNHDEHQYRDWAQTETDVEGEQLSKLQPCEIKYGNSWVHTC